MKEITIKILEVLWNSLSGKKRALGGIGYVLIDSLVAYGIILPEESIELKMFFGSVLAGGIGHAIFKSFIKPTKFRDYKY